MSGQLLWGQSTICQLWGAGIDEVNFPIRSHILSHITSAYLISQAPLLDEIGSTEMVFYSVAEATHPGDDIYILLIIRSS